MLIALYSSGTMVINSWYHGMEKRREDRYKLDIPIKINRYGDGMASSFEASSKDISSGGVFLKTHGIQLETSQRVHLELTLRIDKIKELFGYSGLVSVELDGWVTRALGTEMVVEFEDHYSIYPI
jgi:hypothetical protein